MPSISEKQNNENKYDYENLIKIIHCGTEYYKQNKTKAIVK